MIQSELIKLLLTLLSPTYLGKMTHFVVKRTGLVKCWALLTTTLVVHVPHIPDNWLLALCFVPLEVVSELVCVAQQLCHYTVSDISVMLLRGFSF